MLNFIQEEIKKLSALLMHIQNDQKFIENIALLARACIKAYQSDKKILFAGNGGSAADAQHLATELVTRLRYERPGLHAIALTTDTSLLTAAANDYAFEKIFSRQIEALGQEGDVFFGISTSGKSPNILHALQTARGKKMTTIGFTGAKASASFTDCCDIVVKVPASETEKIQECHILIGHITCALIEEAIFGANYNPTYKDKDKLAMMSHTDVM